MPEVRPAAQSAHLRSVGRRTSPPGSSGQSAAETPVEEASVATRGRESGERAADGSSVSRALGALDSRATDDLAGRMDALQRGLAALAQGGDGEAQVLLDRLRGLTMDPRTSAGLAGALDVARDGALARQILLVASAAVVGADSLPMALDSLSRTLTTLGVPSIDPAVLTSAARHVAAGAAADPVTLRGPELRSWLQALRGGFLERIGVSPAAVDAGASAPGSAAVHRLDGAVVRSILASEVAGEPAALANRLVEIAQRHPEELSPQARLLLDLSRSDGDVRDLLKAHLGAAEFEHAWGTARRDAGDAAQWAFALPDGLGGHTTVRVVRDDSGAEAHSGEEDPPFRLTLGVDFSGLGPIRADLSIREGRLALRMVAAEPATAMELRRRAPEVESLLALEGRQVLLAIADGSVDQASVSGGNAAGGGRPDPGTVSDPAAIMDLEG